MSAGGFDPTFSVDGRVFTDFGGNADVALTALVQPDGQIVVGGFSQAPVSGSPVHFNLDLARYNSASFLDGSFGAGGEVSILLGTARAVALGSGGQIITTGEAGDGSLALARFNANGSLDSTFGTGGTITEKIQLGVLVSGVAVQGDGKLVVVGAQTIGLSVGGPIQDGFLTRFNANGSLDTSFGTGGVITLPNGIPGSVLLQPDNKILVGGGTASLGILRFNPDGSPDTAFGFLPFLFHGHYVSGIPGMGEAEAVSGSSNGTSALALQPDGKILVGGSAGNAFALARFNPDGSLDPSFGAGGAVTTALAGNPVGITRLLVLPDGRIDAAGLSSRSGGLEHDIAFVRYNPDGSLDTQFARYGKFISAPAAAGDVRGLAFVDGDHVVAVGATTEDARGGSDFLVERFVATANPLPGVVHEQIVTQLYLDLLQRLPEPAGLSFWSGLLNQGVSPGTVARAIMQGTEYRTDAVDQLYRHLLHRTVDSQGLDSALAFLAQGNTLEQVRTNLLASDEYYRDHGSTAAGFIGAVYEDTLGREVDAAALAEWQAVSQTGASRTHVAHAIGNSLEGNTVLVENAYQQFLCRQADPEGLAAWVAALQRGLTEDQLVASLATSPESLGSL